MKKLILLFISIAILSCGTNKKASDLDVSFQTKYAATITNTKLKTLLYQLASDEFQGRRTGEEGQKIAANFIADFYKTNNIQAPEGYPSYFQEIPKDFFEGESNGNSENVFAFIEGSDKPEEVLVISAHYDHLGIKEKEIYNGADDDGSGTSAVMIIAQAFQAAKKDGNGPKRSILFLNLTGEEAGLYGSKYYTSHPLYPLSQTIANLNIDMIGRIDDAHQANPNYVYLIGSDKRSSELHILSEEINKTYSQLELDYTYNDEKDPNRFYYRSDHYNFAKNKVPVIFYFTGVHEDYHKATDTADKINYELLAKRTQLIFYTAWEIANREGKFVVDK